MNSYIVAQLGARAHYAVARILYNANMLGHFYTDICANKGITRLLNWVSASIRSDSIKRLTGRIPKDIPRDKITTFELFGLEYYIRRAKIKDGTDYLSTHLWAGKTFCDLILKKGIKNCNGIYTFNGAGLELLREGKNWGIQTIVEQTIAPYLIMKNILDEEFNAFPEWEYLMSEKNDISYEFSNREQNEWNFADIILCGSEFVKNGIKKLNGPYERCIVVPYGVDLKNFNLPARKMPRKPLRVITVGNIGLRKGAPYVLETAKILKGIAEFRMVGPISISEKAIRELKKYVEVTGPVPRSEILSQYEWADVFLFPSLSEGLALVTIEALACGLPVIVTPNSGFPVRDGIDGYLVPIRNASLIAERLSHLAEDSQLYGYLSHNAKIRSNEFSINAYGERLIKALNQ